MTSNTTTASAGEIALVRHGRRTPLGALVLTAGLSGLIGLIGGTTAFADDTTTSGPTVSTSPTSPTGSDASDPAVAPAPATSTGQFTLPLFGTGLIIDVTTGPGGTLSSVAVVTDPTGLVATDVRPREVEIVNADGTAKVVVRSNKGGQRVEARAGSLAEIAGPGGWSGEIFPGVPGSVAFEITGTGGVAGIVVGAVEGPGAEVGAVEVSADGDEQEARVKITFRQDGLKRWLMIKVSVDDDDDDDGTTAKVRISLSKTSWMPFVGVEPGVATTWTGTLCDGAAASITYTVNADGTLSLADAVPTAEQKVAGNSIEVTYPTGERVKITLRDADGALAVKVHEKLRCKNAKPSVNVPVQDGKGKPDKPGKGDHDSDDSDDSDDSKDDDSEDDDSEDDAAETTTTVTEPTVTTPDSESDD